MKKYILILSIFLITTITFGQEFKQWAFDIEGGIHSVNDESAVNTNNKYYIGAGIRHNFNSTFGLGVRFGWDDLDLNSLENEFENTSIGRINLDAQVNLFRVLDLYSDWFTIYAHGGPGISFLDGSYNETLFNVSGGISGLVKLGKSVALKADYTIVGNISQSKTLDGIYNNNNYGITSTIHNVSGGFVFYLGDKEKEHADWYKPEIKNPTNNITNVYNPVTTKEITIREEATCDCHLEPVSEYVFFDHDKYNIKDTELNAIYKVYSQLIDNPSFKLQIKGYASPTSSSEYYNLKLSQDRSDALYKKFKLLGLDMSRVKINSYGKDDVRSDEFVHDAARRVELLIIKK